MSNVEFIAKKSVYGQCIRKQQHFKKKSRRRKAILGHTAEQFRRSNIMDFTEETKLLFIKKRYFPLHKEKYIDPTIFLPDYSILADKNFKKTFLLAAIGSTTVSQSEAKKINNEINMCIAQIPRTLNQFLDQTMVIIRHLIYQDQSQLRMELEGSRTLLKSNAHDHQLFQAFYNLKPRKTEIHSAKPICLAPPKQ
ncbi:unnamed protein product [Adineta ricciae]|uniref:Uncharacterized protein n=1 Tax=Adineta ricciae TaxID=249248 RepID=A0A816H9J3_ADIRI|nr:unnamed protein product [Adineta ricciae]